jgi:membrane protein
MPRDRPLWPIDAMLSLAREWIRRFVEVQGIDRAMSIGAYAYSALIPLLVVYSSLLPRGQNRSFSDSIIARFDLHGSAAESVKAAFAPSGTVQSSVSALGVFYELAFGLPTLGMRNTKWGLLWLLVITLAAGVRPLILGGLGGTLETIVSLLLADALWLITPHLLLGRRVGWLKLLPASILSTLGMSAVAVWSVIWLPHTISASASQYGLIGIGFALLTYLFVVACVLVVAATGGAMVTDRLWRKKATEAG